LNSSNDSRLKAILTKVFLVDENSINDELSRESIEEWDSMGHLMLISEVESDFGVFIPDEKITKIKTVGDLKNVLRSLGVEI
jgi:acyl carrier protein